MSEPKQVTQPQQQQPQLQQPPTELKASASPQAKNELGLDWFLIHFKVLSLHLPDLMLLQFGIATPHKLIEKLKQVGGDTITGDAFYEQVWFDVAPKWRVRVRVRVSS